MLILKNFYSKNQFHFFDFFHSDIFLSTLFLELTTFLYFLSTTEYCSKVFASIWSRKSLLLFGHKYIKFIPRGWKRYCWRDYCTNLLFCWVLSIYSISFFMERTIIGNRNPFSIRKCYLNIENIFSFFYKIGEIYIQKRIRKKDWQLSKIFVFPEPFFPEIKFSFSKTKCFIREVTKIFESEFFYHEGGFLFHDIWKYDLVWYHFLVWTF